MSSTGGQSELDSTYGCLFLTVIDIYGSAPFSPVIVGLVHIFYIMRAFNLSGGNYFLAGALALCSLVQLIVSSIYLHLAHVKPLSSILELERAMNVIVLFSHTALALSITYFLWKLRVGFKRTDGVINILVAFTVGSGLIAGIMSIVAFVAAETMPQSYVYLLMDFCISKLYYNCVLASLNARSSLREDMNRTIMTQSLRLDRLVPAANDMLVTTTPAIDAASSHKARSPRTIQSRLDFDISSLSEAEIDIAGTKFIPWPERCIEAVTILVQVFTRRGHVTDYGRTDHTTTTHSPPVVALVIRNDNFDERISMAVASIVHVQPFKGVYVGSAVIGLLFVRIPFWTLRNLLPAWRPRKSWSIGRCIQVNLTRYMGGLVNAVGGLGHNPTAKALETGKGVNGVWIDGVPELITGDIKKWAEIAGVESVKIPGYWQHKAGEEITMGDAPKPGEKVVLAFHGGSYIALSAHPSSSVSAIPRDILKQTASARRALSVEYRLIAPDNVNPFPTQLIDGLAGYTYLVRTVGFKPEDVIIVGDSAGANLGLALTRYLLTYTDSLNLGIPGGLVLLSPWADLTASHNSPGASVYTNARSDFLLPPPEKEPDFASKCLAGAHGIDFLSNVYISPASKENTDVSFKGFPRSIIVIGGAETVIDSIRTLEGRLLRDLGKEKVETYVAEDAFHDFIGFSFFEPERTEACIAIGKWIDTL
ncbi:alpha/beta-hydrolase [Sanghuangporus baumii]|uniref:Alpha/beta-hydrolase n=1 Tax=Sanghuangporus baumii TaxID=108892 RepID=A0A9Q5I118_SANBA|nr:alpha/beta-hydrolase [Sanghuangporus baumii]